MICTHELWANHFITYVVVPEWAWNRWRRWFIKFNLRFSRFYRPHEYAVIDRGFYERWLEDYRWRSGR